MNDADRHCGVREAAHCEGASFAWGTRAAATLLMLGLAALGWRNADHPLVGSGPPGKARQRRTHLAADAQHKDVARRRG